MMIKIAFILASIPLIGFSQHDTLQPKDSLRINVHLITLPLSPLGNIQQKTYTIKGKKYLVTKTTTQFCPSGEEFCIHGHMPITTWEYSSEPLGFLFKGNSTYRIFNEPNLPKDQKEKIALIKRIKEDQTF
jgi:hypothetical protein